MAATYFAQSASLPDATSQSRDTDAALLATARGDWPTAQRLLQGVLKEHPDDVAVRMPVRVRMLDLETDGFR